MLHRLAFLMKTLTLDIEGSTIKHAEKLIEAWMPHELRYFWFAQDQCAAYLF